MVEFAATPARVEGVSEEYGSRSAISSSSEQEDSSRKNKHNPDNSTKEGQTKKGKRKSKSEKGSKLNGSTSHSKRRHSVSKPARDPRDGVSPSLSKPESAGTRSPSPVIDFDGLSKPSRGTRERLEETPEQALERQQKIAGAVRTILECIGEDPDREGLLATPTRYAKALLHFTKGYQENVRDIVNDAIFHESHNEMVIVKDIEIHSLCEHHLVGFHGKMHIGYIPDKDVIGISKLPRIADMFAQRLQVQERLTKDVANTVMEVLKPQGVAVVMEASHLCMVSRGVQKSGATTITSCVLGCFEQREKTRNEFFSLVGLNRR